MAENWTLFDNFELRGKWWLPENPGNRIAGHLSFVNDHNITLETVGLLIDAKDLDKIKGHEIILGEADGKLITLFKNYLQKSKLSYTLVGSVTTQTSTYISDFIFIGKHFESEEEIKFNKISVNYTYLEEWMNASPFSFSEKSESTGNRWESTVSYFYPPVFEAQVPSIASTVSSTHNFNRKQDKYKSVILSHTSFIKIDPIDQIDFQSFWKILNDLKNLMALFVGEPVYMRRITGYGKELETSEGKKFEEKIEVFFTQPNKKIKNSLLPYQMLITLPEIINRIPFILDKWFNKAQFLEPLIDLFFGTIYDLRVNLHYHFLSLTQALESYHRRLETGTYISADEYNNCRQTIINAIPTTIPSALRESLKKRLEFGNEYSLKKRLTNIMNNLEEEVRKLVTKKDVAQFVAPIVDTRNYFTHFTEELEKKALKGQSLYNVLIRLRILLTVLLLKELEISDDIIVKSISNCRSLSFIWANDPNG